MQPMSENLRALTGVDQLPRPADRTAFAESMARHTPPGLLRSGSVLVDVGIDAEGRVRDVEPVTPSAQGPTTRTVVVTRDRTTDRETQRTMDASDHEPTLGTAAGAALRDVRFTPAVRDGQPVPFTLRMTVRFTPPDAR